MNMKTDDPPSIQELRSEPHLSASGINDYVECGLLYKLSRIDKRKMDAKPDNMVYGSAIHKVLADFNSARMHGETLSLVQLQERFGHYWKMETIGENIAYSKGKDFKTLMTDGLNLLKTYYKWLPKRQFEVMAVEEPFRFEIEGVEIPMIGVMDLIELDTSGTVVITDYKTAARAYSNDQVDRNFQLTVYHMAARSNGFASSELLLRFDCLIKTKTPKVEQYYTTRSQSDIRDARKIIQAVWNGISKGVFVPNKTSWKCRSCGYKSHCDKWFKGQNGDRL